MPVLKTERQLSKISKKLSQEVLRKLTFQRDPESKDIFEVEDSAGDLPKQCDAMPNKLKLLHAQLLVLRDLCCAMEAPPTSSDFRGSASFLHSSIGKCRAEGVSLAVAADVLVVQKQVDAVFDESSPKKALAVLVQKPVPEIFGIWTLPAALFSSGVVAKTQANMLFSLIARVGAAEIDEDTLLEFFDFGSGDWVLSDDARTHLLAISKVASASSAADLAEETAIQECVNMLSASTSVGATCFATSIHGKALMVKAREVLHLASIDRGFERDLTSCEIFLTSASSAPGIVSTSGCVLAAIHSEARRMQPVKHMFSSIEANASKGFRIHNKQRLNEVRGEMDKLVTKLFNAQQDQFWRNILKPLQTLASACEASGVVDKDSMIAGLSSQPLVAAAAKVSKTGLADLVEHEQGRQHDAFFEAMSNLQSTLLRYCESLGTSAPVFDINDESTCQLFYSTLAIFKSNTFAEGDKQAVPACLLRILRKVYTTALEEVDRIAKARFENVVAFVSTAMHKDKGVGAPIVWHFLCSTLPS